jgi:hypothetical protein
VAVALTPREIDAEIARHVAVLDLVRMLARDMDPDDSRPGVSALRLAIVRELIELADRVLGAWRLDREGRL